MREARRCTPSLSTAITTPVLKDVERRERLRASAIVDEDIYLKNASVKVTTRLVRTVTTVRTVLMIKNAPLFQNENEMKESKESG